MSAEIIPVEPDKVMLEGEWNLFFVLVPAVIIAGYFFAKKYKFHFWRKKWKKLFNTFHWES